MTNRSIHSNLVRWLAQLTGVNVIKSHQGEDRPALPYIMVNFVRFNVLRDHEEYIECTGGEHAPGAPGPYDPVTATPIMEGEWDFSIHAYHATDPTELLMPIYGASKLSQIMEPLFPTMVISGISQIRHLPEFINNEWEMRAQVDLSIRGMANYGFELDVIEQAQINVERES